ncbi:hypothetical protein MXE97_22695, partial [Escherichia coli]|nr:hypothetical protein [Escherichia coli]
MPHLENITSCQRDNISRLNEQRTNKCNSRNSVSGLTASLSLVTNQDNAFLSFYRMPSQSHIAGQLFLDMAQENLSPDFNNAPLSKGGESIRNLLGIISGEVMPQDMGLFNDVCERLINAKGKEKDERNVAKDLSTLMSKYGEVALNKFISKYTEHCREAWRQHHVGHDADTHDEMIFHKDILACQAVLQKQIKTLIKPNQSWLTMKTHSKYFEHGCMALSKTLRNFDAGYLHQPLVEPVKDQPSSGEGGNAPEVVPNTTDLVCKGGHHISQINIGEIWNSTITFGDGQCQAAASLGVKILESSLNEKTQEVLLNKLINTFDNRAKNGGKDPFIKYIHTVSSYTDKPSATSHQTKAAKPYEMAAQSSAASVVSETDHQTKAAEPYEMTSEMTSEMAAQSSAA